MIATLVTMALTGCDATMQVVKETVYVPTQIPVTLTKDCEATEPPYTPPSYAKSTPDKKEEQNTNLVKSLYADIAKCNQDKKGIRDYQDKTNKQIEEKNNAAKKAS